MGLAYSEAAVSITVTSVTDFLSFFAGVFTPFPCVKIFSIYTGTAVAFIYVWQVVWLLHILFNYFEMTYSLLFLAPVLPSLVMLKKRIAMEWFLVSRLLPNHRLGKTNNKKHIEKF